MEMDFWLHQYAIGLPMYKCNCHKDKSRLLLKRHNFE